MHPLHIILDSPTEFFVTKTELDIGMVTQPYIDIAYCIRTALCISHNLRQWVQVSICFDKLGPLVITMNPQTIRFLGPDERSILHLIMRSQKAHQQSNRKQRIPYGITIHPLSAHQMVANASNVSSQLLLPGKTASWLTALTPDQPLVMFCPLYDPVKEAWWQHLSASQYQDTHRRDLAILTVLHTLDNMME